MVWSSGETRNSPCPVGTRGVDLVAPIVEQPTVVEPATPDIEEPPVTSLILPRGEVHDEGDPGNEGL